MLIKQFELSEKNALLAFLQTVYADNPRMSDASFWDWPDRPIKERSVVRALLHAQQEEERICWIRSLKSNPRPNVAPDCIGFEPHAKLPRLPR